MEWFGRVEYEGLQCHHTLDTQPQSRSFHMHAHDEMELFYFISGKGSYRVEGSIYPLQVGDIMLMRAAETHQLQISPEEPYERAAIHFSPDLFALEERERLLRPFVQRPLGRLNHYAENEFETDFCRLCFSRLLHQPLNQGRQQIMAYLLPVLQEISLIYEKKSRSPVQPIRQNVARQLVGYINLHLTELRSLGEIGRQFYLSPSQVNRIFHRATGSSVWEYVTIKRLYAARELLAAGVAPGEVSRRCGFGEYSSFYRAYKKQFSCSPQADAASKITISAMKNK